MLPRASLAWPILAAFGCAQGEAPSAGPLLDSGVNVPKIDAQTDTAVTDLDTAADVADPPDTAAGTDSAFDAADASVDVKVAADATGDVDAFETAPPWRKSITIDGANDFNVIDERFTTTSATYDAYVTWDVAALYVGYSGPDIGSGAAATKWLFVYLDADPGSATGAIKSEQYKDQTASFPTGYGAEAYFGWRTDGAFSHAKRFSSGSWTAVESPGVTVSRSGSFVEMRIPFTLLGAAPSKLGVVTLMMNEGTAQWSYAGLYSASFTDGYYGSPSTVPVQYYLNVDMTSSAAPSATSNRKP